MRKILCASCGAIKPTPPEDVARGITERRTVGHVHYDTSVVCDHCNAPLAGKTAVALSSPSDMGAWEGDYFVQLKATEIVARNDLKTELPQISGVDAPMRFLCEFASVKWWLADHGFKNPGVYYSHDNQNVHVFDKLRALTAGYNTLKTALEGLVGESDTQNLQAMLSTLESIMPAGSDKDATRNAIKILINENLCPP